MAFPLKLMCVLAHPDDESLGVGGALARYAAQGVETYLVTATRGERGWQGAPEADPGPQELGRIREKELMAAAHVLGIRQVNLLGYMDGELDQADSATVVAQIVAYLRQIRPQVVVTFGPDGAYGHPDHIAISQFTSAAVVGAADCEYHLELGSAHRVSKFYYRVWTNEEDLAYQAAFGEVAFQVDGVKRKFTGWEDWAVTTQVDTAEYWPVVWEAISCHRSQLPQYEALANLPKAYHKELWGCARFYRAFSLVNGGRGLEYDLFAGLR